MIIQITFLENDNETPSPTKSESVCVLTFVLECSGHYAIPPSSSYGWLKGP